MGMKTYIKYWRELKGIDQGELAKRAGLNPSTMSRAENEKHVPSGQTLEAISAALGISIAELLNGPIKNIPSSVPSPEPFERKEQTGGETPISELDQVRITGELGILIGKTLNIEQLRDLLSYARYLKHKQAIPKHSQENQKHETA